MSVQEKQEGPNIGVLAIIFIILFSIGLSFVLSSNTNSGSYPDPSNTQEVIVTYFRSHTYAALWCAFFQFGAAMILGLFSVSVFGRLRFLGTNSSGAYIALFGGLMAAIDLALSTLMLWVLAHPEITHNTFVVHNLYYSIFAIGGVGYSVSLGIFLAGVSITADGTGIMPQWLVWFGLILSILGVFSWFSLIFSEITFLIPLTIFPAFVWMILVGFILPNTIVLNHSQNKQYDQASHAESLQTIMSK